MTNQEKVRAEEMLRELVAGKRTEVPAEGIQGVPIIYQSGPRRTHRAVTKGPVELTQEREVFVDVSLPEISMNIDHVRYGTGPRTWRFVRPSDPPPKEKPLPTQQPRYILPPGGRYTRSLHNTGSEGPQKFAEV